MRFKSSVLKTIKVRQYSYIAHPKRFPKLRKQLTACIKQAATNDNQPPEQVSTMATNRATVQTV